ncbi:MAG: hypothetical protein QOH79_3342 [Acidimicrobiaceae bacterium]
MGRSKLSDRDLDRVLSGVVLPDDAPPGYDRVTELLLQAKLAARGGPGPPTVVLPAQPAPRRGRKVALAAAAIVATTFAFAGFDPLPSAAANLTAYVARGVAEIGAELRHSGDGADDSTTAHNSSAPESTPGDSRPVTSSTSNASATDPVAPPSLPPPAQGRPPGADASKSHGSSSASKDPAEAPGSPGNSNGHASPHATPPPNSNAGSPGGGPPNTQARPPPGRN